MKIIYDQERQVYVIKIADTETIIVLNTQDIAQARDEFISFMTRLFNDAICEQLKSQSEENN
jgi:hypothetical protein